VWWHYTSPISTESLMIKKYSLIVLQKAINHGLALDESMPAKIEKLHGKLLQIIIRPLNVSFFMQFADHQVCLLTEHESVPDTIIKSSPLGLIRLSLLPASKVRSLFNDSIDISGDVELGQLVKKLFDEVDIDWEGHLARFTGDVVAFQVGSFVRQSLSFKKQVSESFGQTVVEYLQEEARFFPTAEEVNDFYNDVDELSLKMERLLARVQLLDLS